ncbi:LysR family transcriptional regulator [Halotalea alkalilenta]|uniref:LysR family transcriptional regulator n=1 Tax=Halotalea alkalilenta TaxID=376489 RepID=UPI00047F229C|nr:LysR family transcriptional regulator [Halotalea alkalilenta]
MNYFGALEAFVQAAETRSFTQAGRRLGVSSSAIGRSVARLEQELGARLFHRSTRAIALTAEGELFLSRCYRIFAEFDLAKNELSRSTQEPRGRLRISLPQLGVHLMHHLASFQQRFPHIELEMDFSDRLVNVIEEGFDAVLRIGEVDDSRLTLRRLGGYRHRLMAAPDYLSRRGTPRRPNDLLEHACLRYRYPSSGKLAPWPLHAHGEPLDLELPQTAITNSIDPLLTMAEAGLGIALLPDFIVADAITAKRLAAVLDDYVSDQRDLFILWPASRQPQPKIKALIDFMAARLSGDRLGEEV